MEEYELVKKESKHLSKFLIYISQSKDQLPSFLMILNEQFIYILKVTIGSDSHIPPIWHSCSEFKKKKKKLSTYHQSLTIQSKMKAKCSVLQYVVKTPLGIFFFLTSLNCSYSTILNTCCFPQIFKNVDFWKRPFVQWRQSGKVRENRVVESQDRTERSVLVIISAMYLSLEGCI